jgi:hypothetical protein
MIQAANFKSLVNFQKYPPLGRVFVKIYELKSHTYGNFISHNFVRQTEIAYGAPTLKFSEISAPGAEICENL